VLDTGSNSCLNITPSPCPFPAAKYEDFKPGTGLHFFVFEVAAGLHMQKDTDLYIFWKHLSITAACLFPVAAVLCENRGRWFKIRQWPLPVWLVSLILVLGGLNIPFSTEPSATLHGMVLFLISGILGFAGAYGLLQSTSSLRFFLYGYFVLFAILLLLSIIA